jgi:LemA protein
MADILDKVGAAEDAFTRRARRSEVLLSQLYRDETNPNFRAPRIRGLKMMVIISVLAMLVFTGTLFYKYNSFIYMREDVMTKGGNLQSAIQRRTNLFGNLINLTLNHAALEHSVFSLTARMRTKIIKKSDLAVAAEGLRGDAGTPKETAEGGGPLPDDWTRALEALFRSGGLNASLGRLLAVVEQYPDIQASKTYQQLMASLVDMEDRIAAKRVEYNTSVRAYNTAISRFPWYILAEITDFGRQQYYTAGGPGTSAPLITPEIFTRLMPLETAEEASQ